MCPSGPGSPVGAWSWDLHGTDANPCMGLIYLPILSPFATVHCVRGSPGCVCMCMCVYVHVCRLGCGGVHWCVCTCAPFHKLLIEDVLSGWLLSGIGSVDGPQACVCPSTRTWFFISLALAPQDWTPAAVTCNYRNVHVCLKWEKNKNKNWNSLPTWLKN